MMEVLEARGRRVGATAARAAAERIGEGLRDAVPDARVRVEGDMVAVEARGLLRRRGEEPALRWIGGMR